MIQLDAVNSVISQYERFGWKLERILLKEPSPVISSAFANVPAAVGPQDALWFSRESENGSAWELRRLAGTPFALVRVIGSDATARERDQILESVQAEMLERDVKSNGENSNGK
jgi:hypothetical protein